MLGALIFLMCVLSPVCHLHYFTYMLPLIMALLAQHWEFRQDTLLGPLLGCVLTLMFAANLLPQLPSMELVLRDIGLPLYAGMGIWLLALRRVWRGQTALPGEALPVGHTFRAAGEHNRVCVCFRRRASVNETISPIAQLPNLPVLCRVVE